MDAPAGTHGKEINVMLRRVDSLIIPVLPSPIDMRACNRFLQELLSSGRVSRQQTRLAIVANRSRENTLIYHELENYLATSTSPFSLTCERARTTSAPPSADWGCLSSPPPWCGRM